MALQFKVDLEKESQIQADLVKAIANYLAFLVVSNNEDDLEVVDLKEYADERCEMMGQESWFGEEIAQAMRDLL